MAFSTSSYVINKRVQAAELATELTMTQIGLTGAIACLNGNCEWTVSLKSDIAGAENYTVSYNSRLELENRLDGTVFKTKIKVWASSAIDTEIFVKMTSLTLDPACSPKT